MIRLRLISFALATLICGFIVYQAVSARFGGPEEWFNERDAIETVIEEEEKKPPPPPPPPPPPEDRPPPPPMQQQLVIPNDLAPPTEVYVPPTPEPPPPGPPAPPPPPAPPAPPAPPRITPALFLEQPNGRDFQDLFPERALERGRSGSVRIRCTVRSDGRVDCTVLSEDPSGWGFGDASLRAARRFKVAPQTEDGRPTDGGVFERTFTWNAE